MQVLTPRVDLAGFLERVAKAPGRVLMLDYDGTLAPFHVRPERAVPYAEVLPVLEQVVRSGGTRVVVVSGRPADEVPPLLKLSERPEIWGSHGWERLLPDASRVVERPAANVQEALATCAREVESTQSAGARVERKLASVALHWRGLAPEAALAAEQQARTAWMPAVDAGSLELLPFDGGLEVRAVGCNKQYAVKAVLSQTPEDHAVAYLGDDVTDEDAFRAIKLRGLSVLVREQFRETTADVWITPPQELVQFLEHWRVPRT
ncbi:MAG TPA: trehalose-phosphatase [Burkholderiales bacterium]|nr:trehalose-phosphatase [Burkholderiales bacterium]